MLLKSFMEKLTNQLYKSAKASKTLWMSQEPVHAPSKLSFNPIKPYESPMKTTLNSHLNPMSRARKIAPFNRIPWSEPQRRGRGQCPDPRSDPRGCRIPVARCQGFEHGWSEQLRWWKEHKSRLKSGKKICYHFDAFWQFELYIYIY